MRGPGRCAHRWTGARGLRLGVPVRPRPLPCAQPAAHQQKRGYRKAGEGCVSPCFGVFGAIKGGPPLK